jgi:iron complex outermembrane receptor protein
MIGSIRSKPCRIALCAVCSLLLAPGARAQPPGDQPAPGGTVDQNTTEVEKGSAPGARYDEVTVTAAPLPRSLSELATPADVLSGQELQVQEQRTLGETLSREPGISSTYFGPNASRPIIRGQGGEHIRILNNGLSLLDASGTSVDHAVSLDPITLKRLEIVRGPAALLYGPTAVGGVVNAIDGRIPDVALEGVTTQLEPRWNSASSEWGGAGVMEGGHDGFNFHLDGVGRDTKDIVIPGFARSAQLRALDPLPPGEREAKGRLPNSDSATQAGAGGFSYVWDQGYFGFSPSWYHSNYGTVAEPDVSINLKQARLDFAGGIGPLIPYIASIKAKMGLTDYKHTEFEGETPGTVFKNSGWNGRIDAIHDPLGPFEGAFGIETVGFDFSALGEEAFLPKTTNRITSGFLFEEVVHGPFRFQLGGRFDISSSDAKSDPHFGPGASRSFATGSGGAGVVYEPVQTWPLGFSVNYTSRAPNYQELYANGPHLATNAFERGNRDLTVEHSVGLDLSARKTAGRVTGFLTLFYNHFDGYITLEPTPERVPFDGGTLPVFDYRNVPANFMGGELGSTIRLLDRAPHTLDLQVGADYVYTVDRDTGRGLPFIPPLRFRSGLVYGWERLQAGVELVHANSQKRLAPGGSPTSPTSIPTDGYTLLNMYLAYNITSGPVRWDLLLKGNNLNNAEAREATSFLKDIAPLPGVGISGGLRATF